MSTDDDHFFDDLDDIRGFIDPSTTVASRTAALLAARRDGDVEGWIGLAVTALRDAMRDDVQPPWAEAVLQTPTAVRHLVAEPCEETGWFLSSLKRTAAPLPEVWVALAMPDSTRVPVDRWNPANSPRRGPIAYAWTYVEVRGRGLGLPRGMLIRTGRVALDDGPVDLTNTGAGWVRRMGRRVLHGHPVRRR